MKQTFGSVFIELVRIQNAIEFLGQFRISFVLFIRLRRFSLLRSTWEKSRKKYK